MYIKDIIIRHAASFLKAGGCMWLGRLIQKISHKQKQREKNPRIMKKSVRVGVNVA